MWYKINHKSEETRKQYFARTKYKKLLMDRANSFESIVGKELKKNYQYRIVTNKAINAISIIEYILKENNIKEIFIAIFRMNQNSVNVILQMLKDGIIVNIVLSSFFKNNKKYEKWCSDLIQQSKNNKLLKVSFYCIHSKICLVKTDDNKHIVFEGSGNLSDNALIENYMIEDNKESFEFHKKWINELINENK